MSVETITMVISAVSLLLTFAAGFAWMIKRTDERFDGVESRLTERIVGVERELVEVKIAIARIEGPPRHLIQAR